MGDIEVRAAPQPPESQPGLQAAQPGAQDSGVLLAMLAAVQWVSVMMESMSGASAAPLDCFTLYPLGFYP